MTTLSQSMDARGQRRAANSIKMTRDRGAKTAEERDRDSDRKLRRRRNIANTRRMTFCGERPCHTRNLSQPHLIPSSEGKISTQVGYPLNSNVTRNFNISLDFVLTSGPSEESATDTPMMDISPFLQPPAFSDISDIHDHQHSLDPHHQEHLQEPDQEHHHQESQEDSQSLLQSALGQVRQDVISQESRRHPPSGPSANKKGVKKN